MSGRPPLRDLLVRLHQHAGPDRTGWPSRTEWAATAVTLLTMLTAVTLREGEARVPDATLLTFTLLAWLPQLVRTRWPRAVLAAVTLVETLHLVLVPWVDPDLSSPVPVATYQPVPLGTMVAVYTLAVRGPRLVAWTAGAVATLQLFIASLLARPLELINTDLVMAQLVILATGLGALVAGRRERVAQTVREREAEMHAAVAEERLRIARELHDVLAHNLTLVNAQAGVAGYLLQTDPDAAAAALTDITRHTARAIDELRATVGLLRQAGPDGTDATSAADLRPMPDLSQLDALVAEFRRTGMAVEAAHTGAARALGAATELAVYRIVQEALTNAAKHAPGAAATVSLHWTDDELTVRVENGRSTASPGPHPPGTGHGIIGMRERTRAVGGHLDAGSAADGGFVVAATLPIRAERAQDPQPR
jgi:signal transduction histidine kinase